MLTKAYLSTISLIAFVRAVRISLMVTRVKMPCSQPELIFTANDCCVLSNLFAHFEQHSYTSGKKLIYSN